MAAARATGFMLLIHIFHINPQLVCSRIVPEINCNLKSLSKTLLKTPGLFFRSFGYFSKLVCSLHAMRRIRLQLSFFQSARSFARPRTSFQLLHPSRSLSFSIVGLWPSDVMMCSAVTLSTVVASPMLIEKYILHTGNMKIVFKASDKMVGCLSVTISFNHINIFMLHVVFSLRHLG